MLREKNRKIKKKNIERDSNLECLDSQTVSLTVCPWEHKATGLTAHKPTYIHILPYGGAKKDGGDFRGFCTLVGEDW